MGAVLMGTRGFLGFVVGGELKMTYNHWDSYPESLGVTMLTWATLNRDGANLKPEVVEQIRALRLVNEDTPPTGADREALGEFFEQLAGHTEVGWYELLRATQGEPEMTLRAGVMIDNHEFALDSLFCEWGYLVDVDAGCFEVYRGFATSPPEHGRWAGKDATPDSSGYYPVERVWAFGLAEAPTPEEFVKHLEDEGDES
jgi:hypothetical protein